MSKGEKAPFSVRRLIRRTVVVVLLAVVLLVAFAAVGAFRFVGGLESGYAAETDTGLRKIEPLEASGGMVVAANPQATTVGKAILDRGGNALDAAIGVQLALGLVEPDCSGIGGGAFLLYWDAKRKKLHAYDGREEAPSSADENYLMGPDGEPLRFDRAVVSGRSVGAPGAMRMLEMAHRAHGKLEWGQTFEEAIALAEDGFEVGPRLHHLISYDPVVPTMPAMREYFMTPEGEPLPVGHKLANPAYAEVLRAMQEQGADVLHTGPIAEDILAAVREAKQPSTGRLLVNVIQRGWGMQGAGTAEAPAPGELTAEDLASYKPVKRDPLCRPYREFRVCAFGPPTSGGVAVLQILGFLERFELGEMEPRSAATMHLLADAQRLAFLDRNRWVGDPDEVDVPVKGLLDADYLAERSEHLDIARAFTGLRAGTPPGAQVSWQARSSPERPSTSHVSIIDSEGNAVSMTTSIEGPFGSHLMVRGFLLNNELTDFSFAPTEADRVVANAPGPGKRPRSSMSPLIIFDAKTNEIRYVVGSPGGSRIIAFVAQTAIALMDWGLTPQQAVELPRLVARDEPIELEAVGWTDDSERDAVAKALEELGHEVDVTMLQSGLHVIERRGDTLISGVDPRREGSAQ